MKGLQDLYSQMWQERLGEGVRRAHFSDALGDDGDHHFNFSDEPTFDQVAGNPITAAVPLAHHL